MGFVELHFHLLPAVDDGPSSIEESVALAAAAVADGTRTVVATPHVHAQHVTDPGEIPARVRELAEALRRQRVGLAVLPGGEVAHEIVERLTQRQLEAIAHGPASRRWEFWFPSDVAVPNFTAYVRRAATTSRSAGRARGGLPSGRGGPVLGPQASTSHLAGCVAGSSGFL